MPGLSTKPDIEGGVNWSQLISVDLSLLEISLLPLFGKQSLSTLWGRGEAQTIYSGGEDGINT